jgi:hypothetical protein
MLVFCWRFFFHDLSGDDDFACKISVSASAIQNPGLSIYTNTLCRWKSIDRYIQHTKQWAIVFWGMLTVAAGWIIYEYIEGRFKNIVRFRNRTIL